MIITINYNLKCVLDQNKNDCEKEAAHCHITRHGVRVAQVWLKPVRIKPGHSLEHHEVKRVIDVVSKHQQELEEEYEKIKNGC